MLNLTEKFEHYRDCSRMVWNVFLRRDADTQSVFVYDQISRLLFAEIVLGAIEAADYGTHTGDEPMLFVEVQPRLSETPIMVQREGTSLAKYWDDPIRFVRPGEARFTYIECFDWDQFGYRDLRFIKVRIESWDQADHLCGRLALLEAEHVEILGFPDRVPETDHGRHE